jgi:hypothetical protein
MVIQINHPIAWHTTYDNKTILKAVGLEPYKKRDMITLSSSFFTFDEVVLLAQHERLDILIFIPSAQINNTGAITNDYREQVLIHPTKYIERSADYFRKLFRDLSKQLKTDIKKRDRYIQLFKNSTIQLNYDSAEKSWSKLK